MAPTACWYSLLCLIPERNSVLTLVFNDAFSIEQKGAEGEKLAVKMFQELT